MRNPGNRLVDGEASHRCIRCRMLLADCLCDLIPRLYTRTRIVLVLHSLETQKTSNTGRLAMECLANSGTVLRGVRGHPTAKVQPDPLTRPVLLFPASDARPIDEWKDSPTPVELFVPDGTWGQAQRARQRVIGLHDMPCASIQRDTPSDYRLRLTHDPRRLATIEAIAEALGVLEGPEVRAALLQIFATMVERSLRHRVRS
jgi:DTW domain-containing protein